MSNHRQVAPVTGAFGDDAVNLGQRHEVDGSIKIAYFHCMWEDCWDRAYFDMPVCQKHAFLIYVRYKEAFEKQVQSTPAYTPPTQSPVVYYLMLGPNTVKIGTTKDIRQRMMNMRTDLQYVVAVEWGGRELERQRHLEFATERYGLREDFLLSDRLKAHIESLHPKRDEIITLAAQPGGYRGGSDKARQYRAGP